MVVPLENRRWMYNTIHPNSRIITQEYIIEVEEFVDYAC